MDAGLKTVEYIYKTMKVDKEWSIRENRGFSWWSGPMSQRVWSENTNQNHGNIFKVHIESALLRNVVATKNAIKAISNLNADTSMHSFVLDKDEGTLRLYTTGYIHDENYYWMSKALCNSAGMHVSEVYAFITKFALHEKESEATWGRAVPDSSAHPTNGARTDVDDIMNTTPKLVIPHGSGPSPYQESDLAKLMDSDFITPNLLSPQANGSYLTAFVPFESGTQPAIDLLEYALLQIWTDLRHPVLGSGLLTILTMPTSFNSSDESARWAIHLNWGETSNWLGAPLFGGWCDSRVVPGAPAFICFVPACMHNNITVENVAMWMILRSRWAYSWLSDSRYPPYGIQIA